MLSKLIFLCNSIINVFFGNWHLLKKLTYRDINTRYKGSVLGVFWSLLIPLVMLAVYTFVFSVVFKARWHGGTGSKTEFALLLFSGLIIFNVFAECIGKAPTLITSNPNFVKKVVFPIELLPIVALGSSLFQWVMGFTVWIIFYLVFFGLPPLTILLLPLALIPLLLLTLGLTWFLSALSVYVRDVNQITGVITTVLLFLSPIFYSIDMLPESFQIIMKLNPMTNIIELSRDLMIWGNPINIEYYFLQLFLSSTIFVLGYLFFIKTKKGFADVL